MALHESSVNFQNLIRNLAEMYPFEVSEVVVVELVANALDAGATLISIDYDPNKKVLIVQDNGKGMVDSQFDEYHDFAAGLKTRGTGIGFAGVGAKISFNISDRVVTQTRSESFSGGSNWYLESKKKLIWEDIEINKLYNYGTRVTIYFRKETTAAYSSTIDIVNLLKKHYLPLFDNTYLEIYQALSYYSNGLRFKVDGQTINPYDVMEDLNLEKVRKFAPKKGGKRIGYGLFGLAPNEYPIGTDMCGVLLCTHGKVIKSDFFNQFPGGLGPRIFGLVEVPGFINFLTTSKTEFIRDRGKYKQLESLYDPIRQEFKDWLSEVGVQPIEVAEIDEAKKLEKELTKLLEDIPELGEFLGFRTQVNVLTPTDRGEFVARTDEGTQITYPDDGGMGKGEIGPPGKGDEAGEILIKDNEDASEKAEPISRIAKKGPKISFASIPERSDLAWVEGNHVIINSGHPSYEKIGSNTLVRRVHCLFAVGAAVQRFLLGGDSAKDLMFIDRLMAAWGKK